jgi:hypothetical protein
VDATQGWLQGEMGQWTADGRRQMADSRQQWMADGVRWQDCAVGIHLHEFWGKECSRGRQWQGRNTSDLLTDQGGPPGAINVMLSDWVHV